MHKFGLYKKYSSIAITIAIVMMLIFTGPVSAVTLSIDGLDGTHTKGDSVTFNVTTAIDSTDSYIPIENISLKISGTTTKEVVFSTDGTVLSGDSGITVTKKAIPSSNEYGYGYGYGTDAGYGYGFGYGYGYGYGYGSGGEAVEYVYQITIDTSDLDTGEHEATLFLNTGNSAKPSFSSAPATFTIEAASSGGGSSSGGGGGVSLGTRTTSQESSQNIAATASQMQIVSAGRQTRYDFSGGNNEVSYIQFNGLSNLGQVRANIEYLDGTSSLVGNDIPEGMIYRNFNIQIDGDVFDSSKMEDAVIGFKVPKEWLSENDMKPSLISLMHYDNGWEQLDTTLTDEDSEYYSFEAETPSFSPFAIVAREPGSVPDDTEGTDVSPGDDTETPTDTPSGRSTAQTLGIIVLILIVIGVIAYVIYQRKENEK